MKESAMRVEFAAQVGTTPDQVRIETIKHAIGGEKKFFAFTQSNVHIHVDRQIGFGLDQDSEKVTLTRCESSKSFLPKNSKVIYLQSEGEGSARFWCSLSEFQKELDKLENASIVRVYRTLYRNGKAVSNPVHQATLYWNHLMHSKVHQDEKLRGKDDRYFVYSFTSSRGGNEWQSVEDPRGFKHEPPQPPPVAELVMAAVKTKHVPVSGTVGLRTAFEIAMDKCSLAG